MMSISENEHQGEETQEGDTIPEEGEHAGSGLAEIRVEGDSQPTKKKRTRKEPVVLAREPGKSLLPFSRVQKIIKADKDIPIIAKDATFLISLATEEFIKRLCEAGKRVAEREKRATVQHKDLATVVRKVDEFLFLEEIIPWMASDPPARRKPQGAAGSGSLKAVPTLLDQFVVSSKRAEDMTIADQADIVMNEDGTMAAGGEMDDEFE
ncbi:putative transcription factor C16C4.22 [Hypsizygus marmoreus]|uniref:Transcription factor C16C4.22 n=1 Tax=Hypsizygus marmoreus TaxID=39966 RepID=A0A369JBI0_HYPMA|nr:putative transcription factor C16C4.22 [Hypsizygus marmoreus]